ncbi:sensor histidine kinase [Massilia sp. 9096]|uniref:sensor histidine kinase n=1 Tax=Massilia sp. 9096 TaxID=1500894 RepID=UPI0012E0A10B|nr:histidine kinase [Massilia sp. 9096]
MPTACPSLPLAPKTPAPPAAAAPGRTRLQRFVSDFGMGVIVSSWAALLIALIEGRPQDLYQEMVYSMSTGLIAFLVIDGVRLFLARPIAGRRWLALAPVLLLAAPLANIGGMTLGAWVLGVPAPHLADYLGVRRLSMIMFTLCAIAGVTLLIVNRERIERMERERAEAQARAQAIERQALQARLRLMQAQIEPHMLFNTLANLQGLIALDPQQAGVMLEQLIAFLRATLSVSRLETTTLGQEFAAIEAYLGLMAVRMGARLRYRCALPPGLRAARLPTMLLQPLVENAVIHGLEPHVDGGEVAIEAALDGGRLAITIADTGLGLQDTSDPPASRRTGSGVGLSTTRERLQALYGERAGVELVAGLPRGAVARLILPLELDSNLESA